jgi:hypothetical protein
MVGLCTTPVDLEGLQLRDSKCRASGQGTHNNTDKPTQPKPLPLRPILAVPALPPPSLALGR